MDHVKLALKHRLVSFDTDAGAKAEDGPLAESKSHPRAWGTFARILGKYVREEKLLPLEEAIRKMTSLPADQFGFTDRGRIAPGKAADLVIFDAATVTDKATYDNPHQYPDGITAVLVNGVPVVASGAQTAARPGLVIRKGM